MRTIRVLNLGAGVQSTTLYLWACDGELDIDFAVFADTQSEPQGVYEHLAFLKTLGGPRIIEGTAGNLGQNLIDGVNATGQRYVSIPTFLDSGDGSPPAMGRRQCTREYKIDVIEKVIRKEIGLRKGQRVPGDVQIHQVMGLSFDEPTRVSRVKDQFRGRRQWHCHFPLFEEFITRSECVDYLKKRLPGRVVPRSACTFCPYRSDSEWLEMRFIDPASWAEAVRIDHAIREETSVCQIGMNAKQYLHRSCVPLDLVELKLSPAGPRQGRMSFSVADRECSGMCGN